MGQGEERNSLGFAFSSLCAVGSRAEKGKIVPGLVIASVVGPVGMGCWGSGVLGFRGPGGCSCLSPLPPRGCGKWGTGKLQAEPWARMGPQGDGGLCCGPSWHPPAQPSALPPVSAAILLPPRLFLRAGRI